MSVTYLVPAGSRRGGPAAAGVNPEFLVCGLAASLASWEPRQFSAFTAWADAGRDGGPPLPLRLDHRKWRIMPCGAEPANVGECLRFAVVAASDGFPGGLLVLAALNADFAPAILGDMRARGYWMAMSVGGVEHAWPGRGDGDLWPAEVSLVDQIGNQADENALVIAAGRDAVTAWELLAGGQAGGG